MNIFIFLLQVVGLIVVIAMALDVFNQTKKMRAHNESIKKLVREIESGEKNFKANKTKKSKKK